MTKQEALEILDWIPTKGDEVEAMEMAIEALNINIVRCKDCKYWRDDHTCREHSLVSPMGANEFCSRGERGDPDE